MENSGPAAGVLSTWEAIGRTAGGLVPSHRDMKDKTKEIKNKYMLKKIVEKENQDGKKEET